MLQNPYMGFQSTGKRRIVDVGEVVIFGRVSNDFGNFRIMNVADVREQMMLYLEIQSPKEVTEHAIVCAEICRGVELKVRPGQIDFLFIVGFHKAGPLYDVRQHKDDGEGGALHKMCRQNAHEDIVPRQIHQHERQNQENGVIECLIQHEPNDLFLWEFISVVCAQLMAEEFFVVLDQDPGDAR